MYGHVFGDCYGYIYCHVCSNAYGHVCDYYDYYGHAFVVNIMFMLSVIPMCSYSCVNLSKDIRWWKLDIGSCLWVQKVQYFLKQKEEFECPQHHSSCINIRAKVSFVGLHHLPKFWGKKLNATTKVTLTSY